METLLENPIWNALSTRHSNLSIGGDLARKYHPDFTKLAGVKDETSTSLDALFDLCSEREAIGICTNAPLLELQHFSVIGTALVSQMVCDELLSPSKLHEFIVLGPEDVPDMGALAELTKPGPFASRTIEFGRFIGIKNEHQLIAMTGERMKLPGYDEVSAVCVHPDFQGRGIAKALVYTTAKMIINRGNIPFLHVKADNVPAIRSYESIGFKTRREFHYTLLKKRS